MALKAIQAGNTIIQFDDTVYSVTPTTEGGDKNLVLTKNGNKVCTVYNNAVIYWDLPPALTSITTKGQHAVVPLS